MQAKGLNSLVLAATLVLHTGAPAEEVFIGNPGKSLNFFHFDLEPAIGKNVGFPPERLVDYTLLREVQKETGIQ